jgi:quercetin dioxygenase-like cupin family protein
MSVDNSRDVSRDRRGLHTLLAADQTEGGGLSVVDCLVPAGSSGPPLHTHPASDETFIVTNGHLLVFMVDTLHRLGPGEALHVPRGTVHTFATSPTSEAHFLTIHTPGGFEQFHERAAAAERDHGAPLDVGALIALAQQYDWTLAGPPLLPSGDLAPRS